MDCGFFVKAGGMILSAETLAVTYGLSSAITWGAGDFSGGFATRRGNVFTVVLASQILGGVFLLLAGFLFSRSFPAVQYLVWGAMGGICGTLGIFALYSALSVGRMSIVAPLSAVLTAVIPVVFSFFTEGLPGRFLVIGFGVAIVSVWLISSPDVSSGIRKNELYLSVFSGVGFALFFIFIDKASVRFVLWPLVSARFASVAVMTLLVIASGKYRAVATIREGLPFIVLAGILDTAGNVFFALAANAGRLDVSAVLGSLYPAATVILAWFILKERLRPRQWCGVFGAILALVLISA